MKRSRSVWITFAVCLLLATAAVSWLTVAAWRSDQAREQARFDSEVRNALWRMDSLVAPLLAIEMTRPSFSQPFRNAPLLAPNLIKGYVTGDAGGNWTFRSDGQSASVVPLPTNSVFARVDWANRLDASPPLWSSTAPHNPADTNNLALNELIVWPSGTGPDLPEPLVAKNLSPPQAPMKNSSPSQSPVKNSIAQQDRNQFVQQLSQMANGVPQQVAPAPSARSPHVVPSHAVWVGNDLVLARRVLNGRGAASRIECCWLNWPEWEMLLKAQLQDVSGRIRLVPAESSSMSAVSQWQMASLPVRLEPVGTIKSTIWSLPLVVAWTMLLTAALSTGWLIHKTLELSERRAAFVSAVTHELRTPLTTFRLYSEMLSAGMITDATQQQSYYETLHREANRLTHLVENVLAYARLEHGRPTARHETLTVEDLFNRFRSRLEQRAAAVGMSVETRWDAESPAKSLTTNPIAVEQILFNLVDNCSKYASTATDRRIICDMASTADTIRFRVSDFGPGLSATARRTLFRPFQKSSSEAAESAPGVGLGLALSKTLAEDLGGSLNCRDNDPTGVWFELSLPIKA